MKKMNQCLIALSALAALTQSATAGEPIEPPPEPEPVVVATPAETTQQTLTRSSVDSSLANIATSEGGQQFSVTREKNGVRVTNEATGKTVFIPNTVIHAEKNH